MPDEPINLPLQDWLARGLLPTTLSSAELSRIDGEILRQAVFSARTDYADYIEFIRKELAPVLAGNMDEATVTLRLKQILETMEVSPKPDEWDTIKDKTSWERRRLVVRMNVDIARGAGQRAAQLTAGALDAYPALELIRVRSSRVQRPWAKRFLEAARRAGDTDALRVFGETGRMIALKTSETWHWLGSTELFEDGLNNDFEPFAWGSGEGTKQVAYSECVKIGLIQRGAPAQTPEPVRIAPGGKLPKGLSPDLKAAVIESLGDGYRFDEDGLLTA